MAYRFIPPAAHPTSTASFPSAPSAPGLPDTLRLPPQSSKNSPSSLSSQTSSSPATNNNNNLTSTHPLEARLANWRATQDSLKMHSLRRTFGIGEPVRRGMELKIVDAGEWRAEVLGGSAGVHGDVLRGRDAEVGWEDVYTGEDRVGMGEGRGGGLLEEVERRVGMEGF